MTDVARTKRVPRPPEWAGRAALCWAVAFTALGLAGALSGTPLFRLGPDPGPRPWAGRSRRWARYLR